MSTIYCSVSTREVMVDGRFQKCAFMGEFNRRRGICELFFDSDMGVGHERHFDGSVTTINNIDHMAAALRVYNDWDRTGICTYEYLGDWRTMVTDEGRTSQYLGYARSQFQQEFGEAANIPSGRIGRFWFPGHAHYAIAADGTVTDLPNAWPQGQRILNSLDTLRDKQSRRRVPRGKPRNAR